MHGFEGQCDQPKPMNSIIVVCRTRIHTWYFQAVFLEAGAVPIVALFGLGKDCVVGGIGGGASEDAGDGSDACRSLTLDTVRMF